LNLIISKICEDRGLPSTVALGIFNIIGFVNFPLSRKYFALHRKALSIRDILSMVEFVSMHSGKTLTVSMAFAHAVELCIIDGVCLGIDVGSENEKKAIVYDCRTYLNKLL
jgi:midasin (ATPase involved in ribosome maturation)